MGSSRFLPLVIAGFIGLLIGWLLGPDVDDVETALGQRIAALEAKVDAAQAPLGALQTSLTGLDERTTAIATQVQAIGNPAEAVTQLGSRIDAVSVAVAEQGKAVTDGVGQKLATLSTDLQGKLDAMAAAAAAAQVPAPAAAQAPSAAPTQRDAAALAAEIGNTGAVLLTGQTAIFGESRVFLSRIIDAEGKAVIAKAGGERVEIATGASVDLGNGCSVSLAGVAARAAYLAPTGCGGSAAPAAPAAAPTPAAPPAEAAAAAPAPAQAAPAGAAGTAGSSPIAVGQTVAFGEKRAFLSRISAADNTAFLFVPGKGQVPVAVGASADLGDGCAVTLASIDGGRAALEPNGCDATAAAAPTPAAAPAPAAAAAASEDAAPAPAAAPEPTAAAAPAAEPEAAAPAAASAGASTLAVGQTATFGDKRVFLSRLTPDTAYVVVVGSGPTSVATGAAADLGGGCSVTLESISEGIASFAPSGC